MVTSPPATPRSGTCTRSSLGLFGADGGAGSPRSPTAGEAEAGGGTQARRQREDTMRAMRSLDRQYGRRRRLNSDHPRGSAGGSAGDGSLAARQGEATMRALFAPLQCQPQAENVLATSLSPRFGSEAARQLMQLAGEGAVRPRASMPVINGARGRPLQRNRSHASRRGDEADIGGDALTMKSVEIRGGRIVLDDPSSSDASYESDASARASAAPPDEDVRRRWLAARSLRARQPFASAHRLVRAELQAQAPFPLLNDLRRVLAETACDVTDHARGAPAAPASVLLCSDAILVCAPPAGGPAPAAQPLRAIGFSDELELRAADDRVVHVSAGDAARLSLAFARPGARAWVELAELARARLRALLQDLQLDEEDFADRAMPHPPHPPHPRLLRARGRSSIAGSALSGADSLLAPRRGRLRAAAQGGVLWVPDSDSRVCMVCRATAFSMMVRRHHCRACGLIICYRCSSLDSARHRICVRCSGSASSCDTAELPPEPALSVHSLGRRAAEYLPAGELVMQMAAQHEAAEPPQPNPLSPPPPLGLCSLPPIGE
ncbi:hypothetical protein GGI04_001812 [Coemansia thaxteri]|nr:hypothetical protein GGI04_001812 [Coemansia thaxteri]